MDQSFWYAVRVRPQQESIASQSLRGRGLEEFLPIYTARRRWADRVKTINCPLFVGYVFCRFPLNQKPLVLTSAGCIDVVRFGPNLAPVPDDDIVALRRLVESGNASPHPYVAKGMRVKVRTGAFKDVEGYVQKIKDQDQLIVSLHLLQRSVSVHIDSDAVQLI